MHAFSIAADHPCLPGHFPGRPLVPGVLILDNVLTAIEAMQGPLGQLRLPQVKFLQPLLPDEVAIVKIDALAEPVNDVATAPRRWRFQVLRGTDVLATGEFQATTSVQG